MFRNLPKLTSLVLETSAKKDYNLKRPVLLIESFKKLAVITKLTQLHLSGFEIERVDEQMFSRSHSLRDLKLESCSINKIDSSAFHRLSPNSYALNLSNNQIMELTEDLFAKLDGLDMLYLNKNSIDRLNETSFRGLDNLLSLYLDGNQIEDLPVGVFDNLTKLRTLSLSMNRIKRIKQDLFDKMESIEYLDLHLNPIDQIEANSFFKLKRLGRLDLSECKLKLISGQMFTGLVSLLNLTLQHNEINSFALEDDRVLNKANLTSDEIELVKASLFVGLGKLQYLDLSGNKLTKLDLNCFSNLNGLRSLNLSANLIDELNQTTRIGVLARAEQINLSLNKLRLINAQALASSGRTLRKLNLANNQLEALDSMFFVPLTALKFLDLRDNQLEMTIDDLTFSSQRDLHSLELTGNKCVKIHEGAFKHLSTLWTLAIDSPGGNLFMELEDLPELSKLCVRYSDQSLFEKFNVKEKKQVSSRITTLDFSFNLGVKVDSLFSYFPSLTELILSGTSLDKLEAVLFSGLENLFKLDVSNNLIETLEDQSLFRPLEKIEFINLSRNKLKKIHHRLFKKLINLKTLDLSNNPQLSRLNNGLFRDMVKLETIDLSGNGLKQIDINKLFKYTTCLKSLRLSSNQLDNQSINQASFVSLKIQFELTELDISHNLLSDMTFIRNLCKLEQLNLSHNLFTVIYDEAGLNLLGRLMSLKRFNLSHNPLKIPLNPMDLHHLTWSLEYLDLTATGCNQKGDFIRFARNPRMIVKF